jgi:hypothetical protein
MTQFTARAINAIHVDGSFRCGICHKVNGVHVPILMTRAQIVEAIQQLQESLKEFGDNC